jgi:hypothetical protein
MKKSRFKLVLFSVVLILGLAALGPISGGEDAREKERIETLGILRFEPESHHFGNKLAGETDSTIFEIWRGGGCCSLTYTLLWDCSWVDVFPTSGTSHGERDPITVNIDTTGLDFGLHICEITIDSNSGDGVFTAVVRVVEGEDPILLFAPESYDFSYLVEGEIGECVFEIWNGGRNPLSYTLTEECSWVDVSPTDGISYGEPDPIVVSINTTDLEFDSHSCDIVIDSDGGTAVFVVTVTVIEEPMIEVTVAGGLGVDVVIRNAGELPIPEIDYEVWVKGGYFGRIDEKINGTVFDLPGGEEQLIELPVFGLGHLRIAVSAFDEELLEHGYVFLFFVVLE